MIIFIKNSIKFNVSVCIRYSVSASVLAIPSSDGTLLEKISMIPKSWNQINNVETSPLIVGGTPAVAGEFRGKVGVSLNYKKSIDCIKSILDFHSAHKWNPPLWWYFNTREPCSNFSFLCDDQFGRSYSSQCGKNSKFLSK